MEVLLIRIACIYRAWAGIYPEGKVIITGCEGSTRSGNDNTQFTCCACGNGFYYCCYEMFPWRWKDKLYGTVAPGSYQFSIDNGVTFQNSPDFSNLVPGTYNAVARNIATGCRSAMVVSTVNGPSSVADPVFTIVNPVPAVHLMAVQLP